MERTRRELLATAGALAAAGVSAGCLAPTSDGGRVGVDDSPRPGVSDGSTIDADTPYGDVYEAVSPSVARIQTYVEEQEDLFGEEFGGEAGQGSGFRVTEDYLVTNDHVLAAPDAVRVQTADGSWTDAEVVGRDPYSDLAVLETEERLPGEPLDLLESVPRTGTEVLVVGSPLGLEGSATQGIVSGSNRTIPAAVTAGGNFSIADAVQTDAALNPGNSGGPVVTLDGSVVGVATATQGENLGFAVSARLANRVVPELIRSGSYDHSYLGVQILEVEPLLAEANGLPEARGVYVAEVPESGPAADTLQGADDETTVEGATVPVGGDTIVALEETEIRADADLSRFLALETRPGDEIDVTVWREGSEETVTVALGARPTP
ncbi:trypsin-like peptidase domain-containing protein [Halorubrum gandharaense]